jgi:hypothetical protein
MGFTALLLSVLGGFVVKNAEFNANDSGGGKTAQKYHHRGAKHTEDGAKARGHSRSDVGDFKESVYQLRCCLRSGS